MSKKSSKAESPTRRKRPATRPEAGSIETNQNAPSAASVADSARQRMIAEAAYYRAQKRGFAPGREIDDWLASEAEISGYFLEQEPDAAELH